jgi:hypothetical protein
MKSCGSWEDFKALAGDYWSRVAVLLYVILKHAAVRGRC